MSLVASPTHLCPLGFGSLPTELSPLPLSSASFTFPASTPPCGMPGRVFVSGLPEWSPNVQLYDPDEYLRVAAAATCNVRASLAAPVFERGGGECVWRWLSW